MSSANPLWGSPRIHGELLKLDNVRSRQNYKTTRNNGQGLKLAIRNKSFVIFEIGS